MIARILFCAVVLVCIIVCNLIAAVRGEDLIDTGQLGERGAILETQPETPRSPRTQGQLYDVQDLGDLNGDHFDDLGIIYRDPEPVDHPWHLAVVYGRKDLEGRQFIEDLPGTAIFSVASPIVTLEGTRPNHVHSVGDLNGDGFDDFMVGYSSYRFSEDQVSYGAAFLVYGARDLVGRGFIEEVAERGVPGVVFTSSDPLDDAVGFCFRNIGDFNGDGRDDLAVSAIGSDVEQWQGAGVVYVLFDSRNLPPRVDLSIVGKEFPGFVLRGTTLRETPRGPIVRPYGFLGAGIEPVGDFDGDGLMDFLVGATDLFTVYLIRGSRAPETRIDLGSLDEAGLEKHGITVFLGSTPWDNRLFGDGHQFAGIGDIDGDGRSEIALGLSRRDPQYELTLKNSEVYLFRGRPDFPAVVRMVDVPAGLATVFRPFHWGDLFGLSLAPAGDLNGDSIPDFLIGAEYAWRDGLKNVGEVYAIYSRPDFPPVVRLDRGFEGLRILGEGLEQQFGSSVSSAGDFNGDGALDIAVGAPHYGFDPDRGRVYLIYGTGSGSAPFTLLDVTPDFGSFRGGTEVVLRGSGFAGAVSVLFGDQPAVSVTIVSSSEIHAVAPPAVSTGKVDLAVTANGQTRILPGGFEYIQPLPRIDLAQPGEGGFTVIADGKRRLGESVALGDLTGDGAAEVAIVLEPEPKEESWSVALLHGGTRRAGVLDLSTPQPGTTVIDLSSTGNGGQVGMVGDVNGDGLGDLGLGATQALGVILFGRREFPASLDIAVELTAGRAARVAIPGGSERFRFAPAGDIDGDGIGDLAIGVPAPSPGEGQVILLAGRRSWPAEVDLTRPEEVLGRLRGKPGEGLAQRLAPAGDVNGDGHPELLAGTLKPDRAYLIYGAEGPVGDRVIGEYIESGGGVAFDLEVAVLADFDEPQVAGPGDVDGDGLADALVGVTDSPDILVGKSYLVPGARDLAASLQLSTDAATVEFLGPGTEAQAGLVAPAGDFNADGLADFLIGSPGNIFDEEPGTVFLVFGRKMFPDKVELKELRGLGVVIHGTIPFGYVQTPVRETGDHDGDGVDDLVLAERGINDTAGRVHVVFGIGPEPDFLRGDSNLDGTVDLSDAVFTLGYLFLGERSRACLDAMDANDDGAVDLSDPIATLAYLFLAGPPLPPPNVVPGKDSTPDSLDCAP